MTEQSHTDINVQVYQLLEDLYTYGMKSSPRGQAVVEANVASLEIDPRKCIMNFESRDFNWKYFVGELAWYLRKDVNIAFIDNFSKFWGKLGNPTTDKYTGTINSNYGAILLDYHPSTNDGYDQRTNCVNQLEWAFRSLVKDKDSRQAVSFLNCPYYQFEGNKDFVCTMYLNFWIRHDRLDMKVQMRSNDIFFGLSYDAPWFSLLHQTMYLNLKKVYPELQLGMYYHCADNIHYYERHFDLVDKILKASPTSSPLIDLKTPLFTFEPHPQGRTEYVLTLTPEALVFKERVEEKVKSPEFVEMKTEDWKNMLSSLVIIEDTSSVVI
jgi:thymidylate synthase